MEAQEGHVLEFRILTLEIIDHGGAWNKGAENDSCVVRMVGKDARDRNVCVYANGFFPYFFLKAPPEWKDWQLPDLRSFILSCDDNMAHNLVSVSLQQSVQTFCFSDGQLCPFIKLSFMGGRSMNKCKRMFAGKRVRLSEDADASHEYQVCEADKVPPILKFLHDTGLQPSGWVRVPLDKCTAGKAARVDTCVNCNIKDVSSFNSDAIPKFVEASFDGEMVAPSWTFPRPDRPYDMVTQLAVNFSRRGEDVAFAKVLFCVGDMGDLSEHGIEVRSSATESEMLMDFITTLVRYNVDIVTGYNIVDFDFPYLLKRGYYLKLERSYFDMGRFSNEPTKLKESYRSQAPDAKEKVKYDVPVLPGRRVEDCMVVTKKFLRAKLSSYDLETVAMDCLGEGKHPVNYEDVFRSYTDATDRMMCEDAVGEVQDFLSELRLMGVFERLPLDEACTVGRVKRMVAEKWDDSYHTSVCVALDGILQAHKKAVPAWANQSWSDDLPMNRETVAIVVAHYLAARRVGDILVFASLKLDLRTRCFSNGVTLDQFMAMDDKERLAASVINYDPRDSKLHAATTNASITSKKRIVDEDQDGQVESTLENFELRVARELDVVKHVLDRGVTRKFAELWWRLLKDVAGCDVDASVAVDFVRDQEVKEKAYLFAEKTRVGLYCMKDAELPWRIRRKKQHLIALMEMSKISGVPVNMLMEKGETIKVINLFLMWCRANNHVATVRALKQVVFVGGAVLHPEAGFWKTPVGTLDFSSLYPSLMQSHGLCWLSLIHPDDLHLYLGREDLVIDPINIGPPSNEVYYWVRNRQTALPTILAALVSERSAVKRELETETDPTRQVILDQRQLAIKLVANAVYGFTGYERSPWKCLPIAVCTTVKGRDAIATAKQSAEETYGCRVIYGDSVTATTPVLIRLASGVVDYLCIEDIHRKSEWIIEGDKEVAIPLDGLCIWSDTGFTPLQRIIRHRTDKEIMRVDTATGSVCVTTDHSLLRPNGDEVRPVDLRIGDELMHTDLVFEPTVILPLFSPYAMGVYFATANPSDKWCLVSSNQACLQRAKGELENQYLGYEPLEFVFVNCTGGMYELHCIGREEMGKSWKQWMHTTRGMRVPVEVLNGSLEAVRAFLDGYIEGNGSFKENDIAAAGLFFLCNRLACNNLGVVTSTCQQVRLSFAMRLDEQQQVRKIQSLGPTKDYVYDLQTANHHFAAGVGRLVVHNTDSIMIIFPGLDDMPKDQRLPYVFDMSKKAAAEISKKFKAPMKLLFEKVYWPYLLSGKKRYCGWKYMAVDKPGRLDSKGYENVRRDNCPLLRNGLENVFQVLMRDMDPGKATRVGRRIFERIANQEVPMDELIISKTLSEGYAQDSHVHVKVAQYLQQHNPLLAPQIGDRVPYVIIKLPGETRATKGYEKGYNAEMAQRERKEIDWSYYCFKQIKKPLDRIFCVIHGFEYKKGANAKQETDYLWEPYVQRIRDNDKVQQALVNGNRSLDAFVGSRKKVKENNDAADAVPERAVAPQKPVARFGNIAEMMGAAKKKQ